MGSSAWDEAARLTFPARNGRSDAARQVWGRPLRLGTRHVFAGAALALVASAAGPGRSETLMDAIRLAYQTNPTLRGQQATLRATDENVVQARAAMGPQVAVTAQGGYQAATVQEPGIFGTA